MNIEQINDILSDLWSYDLVIIGILISLFVLLYSFIIAKRDELRVISTEIKNKGISNKPVLKLREQHAITYIKNYRKLNNHCLILLLFTSVHFFICWVVLRLGSDECLLTKRLWFYCIFVSSMILTILLSLQIILIIKQYKRYTKI